MNGKLQPEQPNTTHQPVDASNTDVQEEVKVQSSSEVVTDEEVQGETNTDNIVLENEVKNQISDTENIESKENKEIVKLKKRFKTSMIVQGILVLLSIVFAIFIYIGVEFVYDENVKLNSQVSTFDSRIAELSKTAYYNRMSLLFADAIVTDELTIDRIFFSDFGEGDRTIYMNFGLQPSFERYNEGRGKFDLEDRELKKSLLALIRSLKGQFNNIPENLDIPKLDQFKIKIGYNNYPVATYQNEEIKLEGE